MNSARPGSATATPLGKDVRADVDEFGLEGVALHLERVATVAAQSVGDYLRDAFANVQDVTEKRNFQDLVTRHDRETEEMVSAAVLTAVPDSGVLAEEGGRLGEGTVEWIIDPIDGTSNFALGLPHFAVSIGAVLQDQMVAGVIYDPIRDLTYAASLSGATKNGQPLRSDSATNDNGAMVITSFPGPEALRADAERALSIYRDLVDNVGALRRMGCTTLALCSVAEGSASAAYGFGINPWDVAAGYLILEQAGGTYRHLGADGPPWKAPGQHR